MKKKSFCLDVTGLVLFLVVIFLCTACGGEGRATEMKLAHAEGTIGVQDGKKKKIEPADNMGLYNGYQIDTEQNSYAWVNLDNVKLAKLDEYSRVIIQKFGRALELQLDSGSIYFNISEPLGEDESLIIRTSNMAVGIRGTIGWVEILGEGNMKVGILEGKVECSVTDPDTGETVTAEVSEGETAQLNCMPVDETENKEEIRIVIEKIEENIEENMPAFVEQELQEDEGAAERVEKASGIILPPVEESFDDDPSSGNSQESDEDNEASMTGTDMEDEDSLEGVESSEYTDENDNAQETENREDFELLQDYLDNELVSLYGYADLDTKENTFYVDENYNYNVSQTWTGISGIGEARILDLDGDGRDELLVITVDEQYFGVDVYEIENDVPVKKGEWKEDRTEEGFFGDDCLFEEVFSLIDAEGTRYLLYTYQVSGFVVDVYYSKVKLFIYDGEKVYTPLVIAQSEYGSYGVSYDAIQYDENGRLLSQERIYDMEDDYSGGSYNDAYCHERMEALFDEYGIMLGENVTMINFEGIYDDFLSPGTEKEELLNLQMTGEYESDHVNYYFNR